MKVNAFKKLIKEAVAEAVREELVALFETKQPIRENRTVSFTSNDIVGTNDVRSQLRDKMGAMFGYNPSTPSYPSANKLEVINKVDEVTGEPINPYLNFIADAASNMTVHDKAGLRNLDT